MVLGTLWFAVTAGAILATYEHGPSDVLAAALLACGCYSLAARLLPGDAPGAVRCSCAMSDTALALAVVGAVVGGARSELVTQSLVYAVTAFVCATLVWSIAVDPSARAERRAGPARR